MNSYSDIIATYTQLKTASILLPLAGCVIGSLLIAGGLFGKKRVNSHDKAILLIFTGFFTAILTIGAGRWLYNKELGTDCYKRIVENKELYDKLRATMACSITPAIIDRIDGARILKEMAQKEREEQSTARN